MSPTILDRLRNDIFRWADGTPPRGWAERLEAAALRGASWGYAVGSALNGLAYDAGLRAAQRVGCPVVSVGNLSVGGTGKTPVVLLVARLLAEAGLRPAIVSRGYRRSNEGRTVIVSDGRGHSLDDPGQAGDEPLMLARRLPAVPVVVGAHRVEAARVAIGECGADTIVLDDGFQHRALARDCDLVLWDALRPMRAAAALPRGLMRERLGALQRGHAIVLTRCNLAASTDRLAARLKRLAPELPLFRAGLVLESLRPLGALDGQVPETPKSPALDSVRQAAPYEVPAQPSQCRVRLAAPLGPDFLDTAEKQLSPNSLDMPGQESLTSREALQGERVAAFCALGNPASFWRLLESVGATLTLRHAFPDHHSPTLAELDTLADAATRAGAQRLLLTEKDAVKLPRGWRPPLPAFVVTAEVTFGDDADRFRRFLLDRVQAARERMEVPASSS